MATNAETRTNEFSQQINIIINLGSWILLCGKLCIGGQCHLSPCEFDIFGNGESRANSHAQEIGVIDFRRHHMYLAVAVDTLQKSLVDFVGAFQTETNQTHLNFGENFETIIAQHQLLILFGKCAVATNVRLQILNAIQTQCEPQFE